MLRRELCFFLLAAGLFAQSVPPDRVDVSYGPYGGNKLDFWRAKSDKPTPLIVFIHGGGFVNGDKKGVNARYVKACLDAGVSFASINYRFRTEVPIQTILRDSARAIQFLRANAAEFGIDKTRVAAFGGSAGAGTSLWLAFHDDLADPKNADPVRRESTRLVAAGAVAPQATYDLLRWPEVLQSEEALKVSSDAEITSFYGAKSRAQLGTPEYRKILADVDMLGLITKDDPPVFLSASNQLDGLRNRNEVLHAAKHAAAVKKRCDEVGVKAVLKVGETAQAAGNPVEFLLEQLRKAEPVQVGSHQRLPLRESNSRE